MRIYFVLYNLILMKALIYIIVFALNLTALNLQAQTYSTNAEAVAELTDSSNGNEVLNVRYFYYPNLQAYYDRQTDSYLYTRNGKDWIEARQLPNNLRGYSIKNGKRVPLKEYAGEEPFNDNDFHRKLYPSDYSPKRVIKTEDKQVTLL